MNYSKPELSEGSQQLNDAVAAYVRQPRLQRSALAFPPEMTFEQLLADKLLLVQCIRVGIPYTLFEKIKALSPYSDADWAKMLDLSSKSLQRYKAETDFYFKPALTEKILEMAELTNFGLSVFGSMDAFKGWLNTPNYALGCMKPMELLLNSFGKNLVMDELVHIEHGIFV